MKYWVTLLAILWSRIVLAQDFPELFYKGVAKQLHESVSSNNAHYAEFIEKEFNESQVDVAKFTELLATVPPHSLENRLFRRLLLYKIYSNSYTNTAEVLSVLDSSNDPFSEQVELCLYLSVQDPTQEGLKFLIKYSDTISHIEKCKTRPAYIIMFSNYILFGGEFSESLYNEINSRAVCPDFYRFVCFRAKIQAEMIGSDLSVLDRFHKIAIDDLFSLADLSQLIAVCPEDTRYGLSLRKKRQIETLLGGVDRHLASKYKGTGERGKGSSRQDKPGKGVRKRGQSSDLSIDGTVE